MPEISENRLIQIAQLLTKYQGVLADRNNYHVGAGYGRDMEASLEYDRITNLLSLIETTLNHSIRCTFCHNEPVGGIVTGKDGWVCLPCQRKHYSQCDKCEAWFTDDQLTVASDESGDTFCVKCFRAGVDK